MAKGPEEREHIAALYREIYRVVRRIPVAKVLTYGQVAELAGRPGAARAAGAALRASAAESGIPWQRVVGAAGRGRARISIRDPIGAAVQRKLLEEEGVVLSEAGVISLAAHGWLPVDRS